MPSGKHWQWRDPTHKPQKHSNSQKCDKTWHQSHFQTGSLRVHLINFTTSFADTWLNLWTFQIQVDHSTWIPRTADLFARPGISENKARSLFKTNTVHYHESVQWRLKALFCLRSTTSTHTPSRPGSFDCRFFSNKSPEKSTNRNLFLLKSREIVGLIASENSHRCANERQHSLFETEITLKQFRDSSASICFFLSSSVFGVEMSRNYDGVFD